MHQKRGLSADSANENANTNAFDSSKIGYKIIIMHWINYFYTSIESQESRLYNIMLHIKIC